jgi:hypothetical protein
VTLNYDISLLNQMNHRKFRDYKDESRPIKGTNLMNLLSYYIQYHTLKLLSK